MMKFLAYVTFMLLTANSYADEKSCPAWPLNSDVSCNCGEELKNLVITIPKGLEIRAACIRDPEAKNRLDLRNDIFTMDQNNYPDGGSSIYLKGSIEISGSIFLQVGADDIFYGFYPQWETSGSESKLMHNFLSLLFFKLSDKERNIVPLKVPDDLNFMINSCYAADAKITIKGLDVFIGGTDHDGSFLVEPKVIEVGEYKPCDY